ncbi:MAG: Na+/H+ antiporter subunit E [Actinomycetota bacterium]|nr:Na+/H+ antiporter subunit E [Actinomycetota bacterium]
MAQGYILRRKVLLSLLLFLFWIVLTATLAAYDLVLGAICSALVATISFTILAHTLDPRITPLVILRFPFFALALVLEIIKANIDVALIIVNPRLPIDPRIVEYRTYLPDDLPRTVFADSITLTPGTVTLELEEDRLYVHCLVAHHEEGLRDGRLERMVAWLFGVSEDG